MRKITYWITSLSILILAPGFVPEMSVAEGSETIPSTSKGPANPCNPCNPTPGVIGDKEKGKKLFFDKSKTACSVCHSTRNEKKKAPVGPGLKNVTKRHTIKWLAKWLENPKNVWKGSDPETLEMKKRLNLEQRKKVKMAIKKPLSKQEITDICSYLETL